MIRKHILLVTFLNESKLILLLTVKWFQVFLCITNNSIKHQLYVYTQSNNQTVLFQTIQFSISYLFALSFNVKQFYLTHKLDPFKFFFSGPELIWQWMGTLLSPKLQQYWSLTIRWLNVISRTLIEVGFLTVYRDTVGVVYSPSRLGCPIFGNYAVTIDWIWRYINPLRIISCLKIKESRSLFLHTCSFVCSCFKEIFWNTVL